ncbi:Protein CBG18665, partial [Caenorhabditis briggsae]
IKKSKIQKFKNSKNQKFKNSKIQKIKNSKIQKFKNSKIQKFRSIGEKTGRKLWNKLGLLWAATGNQVNEISVHLKNLNIEHEVIPGNEISNHYPQLKFDEKWTGLVDPMGGVIYANKWLNAFQKFRSSKFEILKNSEIPEFKKIK